MKPLVYYYCLDLRQEQKAATETSLRHFEELVKRPPLEVSCRIVPLAHNFQEQIAQDVSRPDWASCVANMWTTVAVNTPKGQPGALLVCCNRDHSLAKKCLEASPSALWGLTNWDRHTHFGNVAIVYELDNHCAIWHELLHILGADDCYALPNRGPTCEHDQCIMQYESYTDVVDSCLPLCNENAKFIKERFAKIKD